MLIGVGRTPWLLPYGLVFIDSWLLLAAFILVLIALLAVRFACWRRSMAADLGTLRELPKKCRSRFLSLCAYQYAEARPAAMLSACATGTG